jgi:hypothetical protein
MLAATARPVGDGAEGVSVDKADGGANPEVRISIEGLLEDCVLKAKWEVALKKRSRVTDG